MNLKRSARFAYLKLLRTKGTPHAIAGGAAIGVFVGLTPTIPFHTLMVFLLSLLSRTSFLAGLITSFAVCNPLTTLPIYFLSFKIGNLVTHHQLDWLHVSSVLHLLDGNHNLAARLQALTDLGLDTFTVMMIGGALLALLPGIASYYLFHCLIVHYRQKRSSKHILR